MMTFKEWLKLREDTGEVQPSQGNAYYCSDRFTCKQVGAPRSKYVASMKKKMRKESK